MKCPRCECEYPILSKFIFRNETEHVHINCPECKLAKFIARRYMNLTTEIIDNRNTPKLAKKKSNKRTKKRNSEARKQVLEAINKNNELDKEYRSIMNS